MICLVIMVIQSILQLLEWEVKGFLPLLRFWPKCSHLPLLLVSAIDVAVARIAQGRTSAAVRRLQAEVNFSVVIVLSPFHIPSIEPPCRRGRIDLPSGLP